MERLPGVDEEPGDRIVCHVDMDCFYASCERLREPELAGEPVVVGMGYEPGTTSGAVATASYEAREFGVESAQPITDALERLPRRADADRSDPDAPQPAETGYYRPVDMEYYESVAEQVKEVLGEVADTLREVSIDEAYLDVTDRTAWETGPQGRPLAEGFARHVRQRIDSVVGVPASVGVAPNMAVAKVASDHDKPDGLTVVPPEKVSSFLAPLPVEAIHGVGPVRARELSEMGIDTAGDLAAADRATLTERFGDRGRELYDRARGRDDREVTPRGRPKSLSRESALGPTDDTERKRETVTALAADVAERARSRGAAYRTIGIKAVEPPFEINTRAESLSGPVDDPELVEEVALSLLSEFEERTVRKLGVRVSNLSFGGGDQSTLDGYDEDAPAAADASVAANGSVATDASVASGERTEASDGSGAGDQTDDSAVSDRPDGVATLSGWAGSDPEDDEGRETKSQPSLDSWSEDG